MRRFAGQVGRCLALADHVKVEELPPAAKKTVEHQTKGATIREIEMDHDKSGKAVYEVEYLKDGVKFDLKVSHSGAVISKKKD